MTGNDLKLPSDRTFGLTFSAFFSIVGVWGGIQNGAFFWAWLAAGAATLIITFTVPSILHPLNKLWMKFAALLNRFISPVVLGVIFYVIITPTGIVARWRGRDVLRRKFDEDLQTYWQEREKELDPVNRLKKQF